MEASMLKQRFSRRPSDALRTSRKPARGTARVWPACFAILFFFLAAYPARAQGIPTGFDSAAVENATAISGGVCSNSAIGFSYRLPADMKAEDAAKLRWFAYYGSAKRGIGPEARYFLWGYKETKTIAMLCGAGSREGSVEVVASPLSFVESQGGPDALKKMAASVGQGLGAAPSAPRVITASGLKMECADARGKLKTPGGGKTEIRATSCAAAVGSYAVMWNLVAYSDAEWKRLVAGMDSVTAFRPKPLTPLNAATALRAAHGQIAPQFQTRLDAFIKAWLGDRNTSKTMGFFDPAAYSAPSLIGSYCGGWYHTGASPKEASRFISENLMGVPQDFPKGTPASTIFSAWALFPSRWLSVSANDVAKDHFLVVSLKPASLHRVFSGVFAISKYGKYLSQQTGDQQEAYWVVFPERAPDGDLFVIFTFWQQSGEKWKIADVDVICQ